jgi:hypothetical protein
VARQLAVPARDLDLYDWAGRTIERQQTQNILSGTNPDLRSNQIMKITW